MTDCPFCPYPASEHKGPPDAEHPTSWGVMEDGTLGHTEKPEDLMTNGGTR